LRDNVHCRPDACERGFIPSGNVKGSCQASYSICEQDIDIRDASNSDIVVACNTGIPFKLPPWWNDPIEYTRARKPPYDRFPLNLTPMTNWPKNLDGDLKMLMTQRELLKNNELIMNLLFQTFISIGTFHNIAGYVHRDTHHGNFLYQKNNDEGYYEYSLNGKSYYLKSCGYNIMIYDFGLSEEISIFNRL